jgi:hypothetical protein
VKEATVADESATPGNRPSHCLIDHRDRERMELFPDAAETFDDSIKTTIWRRGPYLAIPG